LRTASAVNTDRYKRQITLKIFAFKKASWSDRHGKAIKMYIEKEQGQENV